VKDVLQSLGIVSDLDLASRLMNELTLGRVKVVLGPMVRPMITMMMIMMIVTCIPHINRFVELFVSIYVVPQSTSYWSLESGLVPSL
jgi:hypothetical protein